MKHIGYILMILLILASCKTTRQTQTEYIYIHDVDTVSSIRLRVDSIVTKDSIVTFIKGDTVQIEKWHSTVKERLRVDTVEKIITRIEYRTHTETVTVEVNRLRWWQRALMWCGVIFAGSIILFLIISYIRKGYMK